MKLVTRIFFHLSLLVCLVLSNITLAYILPSPFSKLNLVLAVLIIWMLWRGSGFVVWWMFFASFLIELYSTSFFGVILFSGTIAMLLGFWFYQHIFTNRSWHAAIILTIAIVVLYRLCYLLALMSLFILGITSSVPWVLILITSAWEILFTTLAVAFIYLILSRISRHLRTSTVGAGYFKI